MGNICQNFLFTENNYLYSQESNNNISDFSPIKKVNESSQNSYINSCDSVLSESNELNDIPESTKEDNINPINSNSKEIIRMLTTKSSIKSKDKGLSEYPHYFSHELTNGSFSTLDTNRSNDSDTLKKIILIQSSFKNYLISKREKIYNGLKSIKTGESNYYDNRLKKVVKYLRDDYTIISPKNMRRHNKEGFCYIVWRDGSYLKGEYKNNKLNGYAKIKLKDKTEYIGYMENNRFNGYGIYYSSDGTKIEGMWNEGKINGIAIEKFKDGTMFKGEYKNGIRCGIGKYIYSDGSVFIGSFSEHKMNGYGRIAYSDNKLYEGEFKDNLFEGYGEFTWPKGEKYYGYWHKGEKHIFGMYINKNERSAYIGFWRKNKQHDIGAIYNEKGEQFGKWNKGKKEKKYKDYDTAMVNLPDKYIDYKEYFFKTREAAAVLFY